MRRLALLLAATTATPALAAEPVADRIDAFTRDLVVTPDTPAQVTERCDALMALATDARTALETKTGPSDLSDLSAFDDYIRLLSAGYGEAGTLMNLHPDKDVRDAGQACVGRVSDAYNSVNLSRGFYDRLSGIDPASVPAPLRYAFDRTLLGYTLGGIDRDDATRAKVEELDKKITEATTTFARNIADGALSFTVPKDRLSGLPADWIAGHEVNDKGEIAVTTAYPDILPVMRFADDRALRQQATEHFMTIAYPANEPVLRDLIDLRQQKAALLGYESWAHYAMADMMMGSPERAWQFLDRLHAVTKDTARMEDAELLAFAKTVDPSIDQLAYWDYSYFQNALKKAQYDVDQNEVRQYFTLEKTRRGIFDLMGRMFGVRFASWDTPVWDDSVSAWEMYEGDALVGRFYLDLSPREGKYNHAAQFGVRAGNEGDDLPVLGLMTNFPAQGGMDHGDVITFLHEFGHLIQGLFADHQSLSIASRDAMPRDMIEAPSQFLEEWAWDYDTLATFATNEAGDTIPRDLVERMNRARKFGEARQIGTGLGLSAASIAYFDGSPKTDLDTVFQDNFSRYSVVPMGVGHMWASWGHLTGYSSNYYTYNWSEVIAHDLLSRFKTAGLNDTATARAYRDIVLKGGGTRSPDEMIQAFLGRPLSYDAIETYLRGE